ncbi:M20/M25/M40 family metallo-hydrolase [Niabella yanshanensis]|uniref:M20/M25/M40 family metallo-hydrolase n=1 Tax=Niabella yanshanensis TaxID=577386 RepID=A0ABZ0WCD6_9BACT|nr:M20/M25/M40 family metallo-hydrolase [Niabella yanshanensis]WQD39452.1 M20/M25/M40 family metallo-hydrolase [Niabella yanshanensis]
MTFKMPLTLLTGLAITSATAFAQQIKVADVTQTINVLASDEMKGRAVYSPEIDKAADFIASEFKKAGPQPLAGNSYLQSFVMVSATQQSISARSAGKEIDPKNIVVLTSKPEFNYSPDDVQVETIKAGDNLFSKAFELAGSSKSLLIQVDESFSDRFSRLVFLKRNFFKTDADIVFVLGNTDPQKLTIKATHSIKENKLANVVGILPGKKLKGEYVIFSGHYDHIGIGKPENGDSIYNGANDDASGITAIIELARHYKAQNNNERSLIFAAFTAEEVGGFGSQYFSKQMSPEKVIAMFNIEMIGTDSKWGKNSAYITGYEKTDMGDILQKNLEGSAFTFHPDPYPDQQLFYRSDNATLARLGVPAHTISTSKMDSEPNYHKASDEVKTLDLVNMTEIIKSIAISAQTIVSGKDTPTRVDTRDLK